MCPPPPPPRSYDGPGTPGALAGHLGGLHQLFTRATRRKVERKQELTTRCVFGGARGLGGRALRMRRSCLPGVCGGGGGELHRVSHVCRAAQG